MLDDIGSFLDAAMARDPAARNRIEVLALYPGVHALIWHKLSHWLYRHRAFFLARLVSQIARGLTGIEIHPGATIGRGAFIDHGMGVVIGETAEIGEDVTIYQGVTLGGTGKEIGKRHPTIEDGVVVSAGASVLGSITVGRNSKIGAGAVVIKPAPPYSTVVGVPGRVVERSGDQQQRDADSREACEATMSCNRGADYHYAHRGREADLNHGDLPDPLGRALDLLALRIKTLEDEVAVLRKARAVSAGAVSGATITSISPIACDAKEAQPHDYCI
ncbi:MAG: serine O-acetyltransferase EpsC [Clostridia bacterium]|nr:serine O-acetyltransferase EpsC [Clostridia bacterium]